VQGVILPVENDNAVSSAYSNWDNGNACDPRAANQVAEAIRNTADAYLSVHSSVQYLVIVGDDTIIPFHRVPDDGLIANESVYAGLAGLKPNNPTVAALEQGYILTDDFYADRTRRQWRGRELSVPDLAIGRLVETPQEIMTIVDTYLNQFGVLYPNTALVTGYDFLSDGSQAIRDALASLVVAPTTLISDSWTADDLTSNWLGVTRQDIASINAHFDHENAIPAAPGSATVKVGDIVASTLSLDGTLNFSMGCHSGYNVPDENATTGHELDFAQALARRGAWWIGNTGFGYGMDDAVSFTERVMALFAKELTTQSSIGKAFQSAKQRYLGSTPNGSFGTYDEKAMIEATLYGLPMYRISRPSARAQAPVAAIQPLVPAQATALSAVTVALTPAFYTMTVEAGSFYTVTVDGQIQTAGPSYEVQVDGQIQASPGRPVQPSAAVDLPVVSGMAPHGTLFSSGHIARVANFDPVIARPVTDTALPEPAYAPSGWYPLKPFAVNLLGDTPRLVVVPTQYQGDENSGVEQLYQNMDLVIYYADAGQTDYVAPSIWEVDGLTFQGVTTFKVLAQDDSGVERVVVTYSEDGLHWQSVDLTYNDLTDRWEGVLGSVSSTASYFIQAVDKTGNVSMSANKGFFFEPTRHDIYLPIVMR
jgi:hypothetical protein